LNYIKACWVKFEKEEDIAELKRLRSHNLFYDKHDELVFMAESEYQLNAAREKNPKANFYSALSIIPKPCNGKSSLTNNSSYQSETVIAFLMCRPKGRL